jgi:hypothetical protein
VAHHLAGGFPGHRFRPNAVIDRGQGASMLWRLALTPISAWGISPEDVMPTSPQVAN